MVKARAPPPESTSAHGLRVLTISHRERVRVAPLPATGSLSLGRGDECDIQLSGDPLISRRHALLHVRGGLLVEDLGSQNGTRILGGRAGADPSAPTASSPERLRAEVPTPLPEGATFQLGNTLLSVEAAALAPARGAEVDGVVVADARMRHLYALLERVAGRQINVLLLGETGVGKDVFARRIHALSPRAAAPFMGINCGALSESLLESELFGHEKGAFTGAYAAKPGLFEAAAGGVAFLDEVGELPLNVQVKLLRVLEDRSVLRVGAVRPTPIDVRIVAATNRDLDRAVAAGLFRSDLYYRLDGISFVIPPLRERAAEILPLASLWLRRFGEKEGRPAPPLLSAEAAQKLTAHPWPGNVRELRNVIERALVLCDGAFVLAEHVVLAPTAGFGPARPPPLPGAPEPPRPTLAPPPVSASAAAADLLPSAPLPWPPGAAASPSPEPTEGPSSADDPAKLRQRADELEREHLRATLEACAGNQSRAAARLGVTRRVLLRRLEHFQLTRQKKSSLSAAVGAVGRAGAALAAGTTTLADGPDCGGTIRTLAWCRVMRHRRLRSLVAPQRRRRARAGYRGPRAPGQNEARPRVTARSGGAARGREAPRGCATQEAAVGGDTDHSRIACWPGRSTCTLSSTEVTQLSGM